MQYYRGEKLTPLTFEMTAKDAEKVTLADGSIEYIAEHVWERPRETARKQKAQRALYSTHAMLPNSASSPGWSV